MKMNRTSSVVEYRLGSRFEQIRAKLLTDAYAQQLERPLAFWAMPDDRRLPLAFMGRTVRELLATPFDELLATPGVGQKKIASLVTLLVRVSEQSIDEPVPADQPSSRAVAKADDSTTAAFDPNAVSESLWAKWRAVIVRHGIEREPIGRFTPSLENLPRVLWNTPLETYTPLTLDEIRHLKTHGEKRVNAVLEVFCCLHCVLTGVDEQSPLAVYVVPRFVPPLEKWVAHALASADLPTPQDVERNLIEPLIEQIEVDAGGPIARLAEKRIGVRGDESSVRQTARKLGVTRARVYQLLAEIGEIIGTRWPEGQALVSKLAEKIETKAANRLDYAAFHTAVDLFFPDVRAATATQHGERNVELPADRRRRAG